MARKAKIAKANKLKKRFLQAIKDAVQSVVELDDI